MTTETPDILPEQPSYDDSLRKQREHVQKELRRIYPETADYTIEELQDYLTPRKDDFVIVYYENSVTVENMVVTLKLPDVYTAKEFKKKYGYSHLKESFIEPRPSKKKKKKK